MGMRPSGLLERRLGAYCRGERLRPGFHERGATMTSSIRFLQALLLVAGLAINAQALAQPRFSFADTPSALSKDVTPSFVRLRLDVDPASPAFDGQAQIDLAVRRRVDFITVHAHQLEAQALSLRQGRQARALKRVEGGPPQTWRLAPEDGRPIAPGRYRLDLQYRGTVQTTGQGLFAVNFRAHSQPARMLATQLEAIDARRLMPSFDEPVFRARYALVVRAPAGYEVLSNMPRVRLRNDGDARLHHFAPTPPMQSYLLALSVGRFDMLEDEVEGIPLRIVTAPGKRDQARAAMDATKQLLPYFRAYFGRPYALPKLDQVAVPGVRVGAMEDWGLISYAESRLLFEPGRTDPGRWPGDYELIAHEISHQWFGNLVSPASWSEIWLNEAFATWMAQKAADHFHPEWQVPLRTRRNLERTMDRDATPATRAIRAGAVDEMRVNDVFDNITYQKGGAVLSMLEQWIGPEAFRAGLRAYMAERAMKPATAGDLWYHMEHAAGRPVAAVARQWTDQIGMPLVSVEARCEQQATEITLRQRRMAALDALPETRWPIPVRLARGTEQRLVLLDGESTVLRWPGCDDRPLLANAGAEGYFRVRHAPALQQRLTASFARLAPADRLALVADSYALAAAGEQPLAEHLPLLLQVGQVQDDSRPALYTLATTQLQQLDLVFAGQDAQPVLRAWARALLAPEFERIGWKPAAGENSEVGALRAQLATRLGQFGHPAVLAGAKERFAAALANDTARVPPALRRPVLGAAAAQGGVLEFEALLTALLQADSPRERSLLLGALAHVPDPALVRRLLDEALSGRLPPDISAWIPYNVAQAPGMGPMAYAFVVEHWAALSKLAGNNVFAGDQWLLPNAAGWASDATVARQLMADQLRLRGAAGEDPAARTSAVILSRHRLREREAGRIGEALKHGLRE